MKNKYKNIICVLLAFCLMAASVPAPAFAVGSEDEKALAEVSFLQSELRKGNGSMPADARTFDLYALDLQCLNRLKADPSFLTMSEEEIIERVRQCSRQYRNRKTGYEVLFGVGIFSWLLGEAFVRSQSWRLAPSIIGKGCVELGRSLSVMAVVLYLLLEPEVVSAGQAPGGFEYLQKLKQNPVLFEDIVQARQLLEGPLNADGSVSRYLENYKTYLQNMKSTRFALQLPEIEAEYRGWAQTHGVSADKPDMMKYMEIASRYPMSERERRMRGIRAKETLKRVQKSLREAVSKPIPGI